MAKFRPKTQMLLLGASMMVLSSILIGGVLIVLPAYLKIKHSSPEIPAKMVALLLRDNLVILSTIAVFPLLSARAVFRNRAHLKEESSASVPATPDPRRRALLAALVWFVLGSALGAGVTFVLARFHYFKITVDAMLMARWADHGDVGERATEAYYQGGSRPVAIYALLEYLHTLEEDARLPETPYSPQKAIAADMVLQHGRLAKLYRETGQMNLSAQHVAQALDCSKRARRTLTNQTELADFVASMDRLGYRARYKTNLPPNPQGGADGRQPGSSETNRMSAAAASRRSP